MSILSGTISKFNKDPNNYNLAFQIAHLLDLRSNEFNKMRFENTDIIKYFTDAISDKQNLSYYIKQLLRVYATYLRDEIALVAFTGNKEEELNLIEIFCDNLSISYNKVKVKRCIDSYCITHKEIVPEDEPCPKYTYPDNEEEDECYVE